MSRIETVNGDSAPNIVTLRVFWIWVVCSFVTSLPLPSTMPVVFLLHLIEKPVTSPKFRVSLVVCLHSLLGVLARALNLTSWKEHRGQDRDWQKDTSEKEKKVGDPVWFLFEHADNWTSSQVILSGRVLIY